MAVRALAAGMAAVLVLAFGFEQALAGIALRDDARRPAWVRYVPAGVAARVDGLNPALPLPAALRLVLARRALAAGNFELVAGHVARLPASRDRAELSGALAEHRGDPAAALRDFLEAGDLDGIEHRVEALAASGRGDEALALQRSAIARATGDPAQTGNVPEAYYRLGLLEQRLAYQIQDPGARTGPQQQSLADYRKAVELAPLEERYLIAAGNEEINVGDLDAASTFFQRARDSDPSSADALTGFGDIALRRGDTAEAKTFLAQARRLNPNSSAVQRLAHKLGE
jgi:tetratricopeptide (TPR) repeat protein